MDTVPAREPLATKGLYFQTNPRLGGYLFINLFASAYSVRILSTHHESLRSAFLDSFSNAFLTSGAVFSVITSVFAIREQMYTTYTKPPNKRLSFDQNKS